MKRRRYSPSRLSHCSCCWARPGRSSSPAANPPAAAKSEPAAKPQEPAREKTAQQESPGQQLAEASEHAAGEGEENAEFKQSPSVRFLAKITGLSLRSAYWLAIVLNFAVIGGAVVWFAKSKLPGMFRARTESIRKTMEEAQRASADAGRRLSEIEGRLAKLDSEIAAMRVAGRGRSRRRRAAHQGRRRGRRAQDRGIGRAGNRSRRPPGAARFEGVRRGAGGFAGGEAHPGGCRHRPRAGGRALSESSAKTAEGGQVDGGDHQPLCPRLRRRGIRLEACPGERAGSSCTAWCRWCKSNPILQRIWENPSIPAEQKRALAGRDRGARKRLQAGAELPGGADRSPAHRGSWRRSRARWRANWTRGMGFAEADVISARELSADEKARAGRPDRDHDRQERSRALRHRAAASWAAPSSGWAARFTTARSKGNCSG